MILTIFSFLFWFYCVCSLATTAFVFWFGFKLAKKRKERKLAENKLKETIQPAYRFSSWLEAYPCILSASLIHEGDVILIEDAAYKMVGGNTLEHLIKLV